ncbi:MAG: hypothetical protein WCO02_13045 [Bacteroidota bacterium]
MRRIFKILPLVIIYFITCAKSCNEKEERTLEMEKRQAVVARDSISSLFETARPDQATLRAFEVTAGLKLKDLSDYLSVMNDSNNEKAFREKAGKMAAALFVGGKDLPLFPKGTIFDSIRVVSPLARVSDTLYSGQISLLACRDLQSAVKTNTPAASRRSVDFFIVKQRKVFGGDTLRVWNVLFGKFR